MCWVIANVVSNSCYMAVVVCLSMDRYQNFNKWLIRGVQDEHRSEFFDLYRHGPRETNRWDNPIVQEKALSMGKEAISPLMKGANTRSCVCVCGWGCKGMHTMRNERLNAREWGIRKLMSSSYMVRPGQVNQVQHARLGQARSGQVNQVQQARLGQAKSKPGLVEPNQSQAWSSQIKAKSSQAN